MYIVNKNRGRKNNNSRRRYGRFSRFPPDDGCDSNTGVSLTFRVTICIVAGCGLLSVLMWSEHHNTRTALEKRQTRRSIGLKVLTADESQVFKTFLEVDEDSLMKSNSTPTPEENSWELLEPNPVLPVDINSFESSNDGDLHRYRLGLPRNTDLQSNMDIQSAYVKPVTDNIKGVNNINIKHSYINSSTNKDSDNHDVNDPNNGMINNNKEQWNKKERETLYYNIQEVEEKDDKVIDELNDVTIDKIIYVITPTYRRPEQIAELTRLAQTLMLIKRLHWIVAEEAKTPTQNALDFLRTCSVSHTYLLVKPQRIKDNPKYPKARGVNNRNAALKWIQYHAKREGVFYFADDDNTYNYRIFNQIRTTDQVSMFPVGLVTSLGVSSPIVRNGNVVGFYDGWIAGRRFPIDMAGFAVHIKFYIERGAPLMPYIVGFEEDGFLKSLKVTPQNVMPLADNCTKILVWHTRTVQNPPAKFMPKSQKVDLSNL